QRRARRGVGEEVDLVPGRREGEAVHQERGGRRHRRGGGFLRVDAGNVEPVVVHLERLTQEDLLVVGAVGEQRQSRVIGRGTRRCGGEEADVDGAAVGVDRRGERAESAVVVAGG